MTFELDLEQARAVARDIDPALEALAVTRLHGGSTEVFRIDLAAGDPLVLKLYPDEPVWNPGKEQLVAGWIGDAAGIAIPRWLKLDMSRTLLPMRWAVTTWLPGGPMREFFDHPGAADAWRRMGALLRRFHSIRMPAFGYILDDGINRPQPDNASHMAGAFQRAFAGFRRAGGDAELADKLQALVAARSPVLAHCDGAVLCHDDFQPGNVLVQPDGDGGLRLTALIDFGNAQAGDPLMDVAKSILTCRHEHAPGVAPLLEGYGPLDHPDAEGAIWLYLLYHRMTLWTYLRAFGAAPDALLADLAGMAAA